MPRRLSSRGQSKYTKGFPMSFPAPTKGIWPEKPATRLSTPRAPRTSSDTFTSYPPPTTGRNTPVKFAPIAPVSIWAGETYQLIPALLDIEGNLQTPTEKLRYTSNNAKIFISDTGTISTNIPASQHSRRGSAVTATIQIHHGGINTFVPIVVRVDDSDTVSD
jgi:hypothetical protein